MSPYCYLLRKFELGERKQLFQWEKVEGLPSRIKVQNYEDLPKEAQFHKDKEMDLRGKYIRTLTNTGNLLNVPFCSTILASYTFPSTFGFYSKQKLRLELNRFRGRKVSKFGTQYKVNPPCTNDSKLWALSPSLCCMSTHDHSKLGTSFTMNNRTFDIMTVSDR